MYDLFPSLSSWRGVSVPDLKLTGHNPLLLCLIKDAATHHKLLDPLKDDL